MGIFRKAKQVVTAPAKAVAKGAKALGNAVDPAKAVARAVDKTVDTFKDDEFVVKGESSLVLWGFAIGTLSHTLRITVADKGEQ